MAEEDPRSTATEDIEDIVFSEIPMACQTREPESAERASCQSNARGSTQAVDRQLASSGRIQRNTDRPAASRQCPAACPPPEI